MLTKNDWEYWDERCIGEVKKKTENLLAVLKLRYIDS